MIHIRLLQKIKELKCLPSSLSGEVRAGKVWADIYYHYWHYFIKMVRSSSGIKFTYWEEVCEIRSCFLPKCSLQKFSGLCKDDGQPVCLNQSARNPHALLANQLTGTGKDSWHKWTLCQRAQPLGREARKHYIIPALHRGYHQIHWVVLPDSRFDDIPPLRAACVLFWRHRIQQGNLTGIGRIKL